MQKAAKSERGQNQDFCYLLKTGVLVLLLTFSLTEDIFSEEKNIKFENISIEQGLSQSGVSCIIQDSKGFMWFGTEEGLNKFDGYTFNVYSHEPDNPNSMGNNSVLCIFFSLFYTVQKGPDASCRISGTLCLLDFEMSTEIFL